MNSKFIKKIIDNPYIIQYDSCSYTKSSFCYRKELHRIDIEIKCWCVDNNFFYGTVDVYVDNLLTGDINFTFESLNVPGFIQKKGVGKHLMLYAYKIVREFKSYFGIQKKVQMKGLLSSVDKRNGNWDTSVPFYEKVARYAGVESYFTIDGQYKKLQAEVFLKATKDTDDGHVIFLI